MFLTARLAILSSLSFLSRATSLSLLSSLFHSSLTLLSLTLTLFPLASRHSLPSSSLHKIRNSRTHAHKRIHTLSVSNASHKQPQGLTFSIVYATPLGTSAIIEHWRESWVLSQNCPSHVILFSNHVGWSLCCSSLTGEIVQDRLVAKKVGDICRKRESFAETRESNILRTNSIWFSNDVR